MKKLFAAIFFILAVQIDSDTVMDLFKETLDKAGLGLREK